MVYEDTGKPRGGGEKAHVLSLTKSLRNRGHNVLLFQMPPLNAVADSSFAQFQFLSRTHEILRVIRNDSVIHAHGARLPLILGCFVRRITGARLIVTIHEVRSLANRLNPEYKRADRIIAISPEIESILKHSGVDPKKLIYIPNMVESARESDFPDEDTQIKKFENVLLFMGRLENEKIGLLKVLLEATPKILEAMPSTLVWIVGHKGSGFLEMDTMTKNINEKIGRRVVQIFGYVKDPYEMMNAADIVLGVGRVAMEAMAFGKVTIIGSCRSDSRLTGALVGAENIKELARHNFSGRNYTETIDSERMKDLVVSLLKDDCKRKKLGIFCKEMVTKCFGSEHIIPQIESVYFNSFEH